MEYEEELEWEYDNPRYDDRDSSDDAEYVLRGWNGLSWDRIARDEDDYTDSLKLNDQIMGALDVDDDIEFARLLENGKRNSTRRILKDAGTGWFAFCPTELLSWILSRGAKRCLDLLLSGKTGLSLDDLNAPLDSGGMFPIHVAASTPPFAFVQLLIARGARTDVICKNPNSSYHLMLPIETALFKLREKIRWDPTQSVFDLIFSLYRQDFVEAFDAIKELLLHSREELIHGVIHHYVAEGLIIELAALLLTDAIFSVGHFSGLSHEGYGALRLQVAKELVYLSQEDCMFAIDGNGTGNGHGNGNGFPCNEYRALCPNVAEELFSPLEKEYMSAMNWHWKGNGDVVRRCINEPSLPRKKYIFAKEESRNQNAMLDMLIHRKITLMSTMLLLETFCRTDLTALGFGNSPEALAKRLIDAGFDLIDDDLIYRGDILGNPIHTCMPKKLEYHRINADPKSYLQPQGLFTTMPILTPTNQRKSDFAFSYHGKRGLSSAVQAFRGASQRFQSGCRVYEVVEASAAPVADSEQTNSYCEQVIRTLAMDNDVEFADFLLSLDRNKNRLGLELSSQQQLLSWIIGHGARRCFELLVLGRKSGTITNAVLDLNAPLDLSGLFPIHVAATTPPFTFVDLCIAYGARTDVICRNPESRYHSMLPIEATISILRENSCWKRTQTVYDMLFSLYNIDFIETINAITHLLAHTTEELILRVIYRYAMEGMIVELGALLLVDAFSTACFQHLSPEQYMALRLSVSEAILSLSEAQQLSEPDGNEVDRDYINKRKMLMSSTLLLLEIFFRTDFRELKFGDEMDGLALRMSAAGFDLTTHIYLSLRKVWMPNYSEHYKTIDNLPSYLKPRGLLNEARPIKFPINQQKSGFAFSLIEKRGLSSAVQAFHTSQRFKSRSRPMLCTPMDGPSEAGKAPHGKGWKIMHSRLPRWSGFVSAIRRVLHA